MLQIACMLWSSERCIFDLNCFKVFLNCWKHSCGQSKGNACSSPFTLHRSHTNFTFSIHTNIDLEIGKQLEVIWQKRTKSKVTNQNRGNVISFNASNLFYCEPVLFFFSLTGKSSLSFSCLHFCISIWTSVKSSAIDSYISHTMCPFYKANGRQRCGLFGPGKCIACLIVVFITREITPIFDTALCHFIFKHTSSIFAASCCQTKKMYICFFLFRFYDRKEAFFFLNFQFLVSIVWIWISFNVYIFP